jgi:hypothetical protein
MDTQHGQREFSALMIFWIFKNSVRRYFQKVGTPALRRRSVQPKTGGTAFREVCVSRVSEDGDIALLRYKYIYGTYISENDAQPVTTTAAVFFWH